MFGRFASFVGRTAHSSVKTNYLPKYQYCMLNKETTGLLSKTSMVPTNLLVRNLRQMLQKLTQETQPEVNTNVKSLSFLGQGTLRMSHITTCGRD